MLKLLLLLVVALYYINRCVIVVVYKYRYHYDAFNAGDCDSVDSLLRIRNMNALSHHLSHHHLTSIRVKPTGTT